MNDLVKSCLYNWLGYGNLNGDIWFIGSEEGGAEIWRCKTLSLEESLNLRKDYSLSMGFKEVWENKYGIPLESFKGPNVWRYMAAFLLNINSMVAKKSEIQNFVFIDKRLGDKNSNHFLCELLPLPKISKNNISPYNEIWSNISEYYNEVLIKRFDLINNTLKENKNVKLIIAYEFMLVDMMLDYFTDEYELLSEWKHKEEIYVLYKINLSNDRKILLLKTPFFGNGRISYDGINNAVEHLKVEIDI